MDIKKVLIGSIGGGIVLYLVGYLIFDLAFGDFYASNLTADVGRDPNLMWAMGLGSLSYATLITLGIVYRADSFGLGSGVRVGAIIGFLLWFTVDFTFYGMWDISALAVTIVDPLLEMVRGGLVGGAIAFILGKTSSSVQAKMDY